MKEPIFLSAEQVERFHRKGLDAYGGLEGVRDQGAFEGAVFQAQNVYFYENGDLFDVAAAYCFHIAQAQAFLDGNKRTAVTAGLVFLDLNEISIDFDWEPLYEAMIAIADRKMDRSGLADLLRKLCA